MRCASVYHISTVQDGARTEATENSLPLALTALSLSLSLSLSVCVCVCVCVCRRQGRVFASFATGDFSGSERFGVRHAFAHAGYLLNARKEAPVLDDLEALASNEHWFHTFLSSGGTLLLKPGDIEAHLEANPQLQPDSAAEIETEAEAEAEAEAETETEAEPEAEAEAEAAALPSLDELRALRLDRFAKDDTLEPEPEPESEF